MKVISKGINYYLKHGMVVLDDMENDHHKDWENLQQFCRKKHKKDKLNSRRRLKSERYSKEIYV